MLLNRWTPFLALISIISLFLAGCASPKAPTGGVEDMKPPSIITEGSTPNRQTNFKDREIVLLFDEWVTLKDVYNQLIISPPMPQEPEIRQKGKAVIIALPDSLREETTYTINMGNAIADLNEGNVLDNFVFVFSTGPNLDSLSLRGSVVNALTLKPSPNIWVMLYSIGEDSAVYKRRPDYLSKTDTAGRWSVSFLPADSFDIVALKDDNVNFLYDQEAEWIGWTNEPVYTGTTSAAAVPPIFVFPREERVYIREAKHLAPGWIKLLVDAPEPKPLPIFTPAIDESIIVAKGDTVHIWYPPSANYGGFAVLDGDSTTIRQSQPSAVINERLTIKPLTGRLKPGGTARFITAIPVTSLDTTGIEIRHDSLGSLPFTVETSVTDAREFSIQAPWTVTGRYALTILPGAITDFWGRTNDSIFQSITISGAEQFGDLTLTTDGLDSNKQYLLLLKEGEQIIDTFVIVGARGSQVVKRGLSPGKYTMELVEDLNRNGDWDTGNYDTRRQPERKMIFGPEVLRAGWEQEVKLTWRE